MSSNHEFAIMVQNKTCADFNFGTYLKPGKLLESREGKLFNIVIVSYYNNELTSVMSTTNFCRCEYIDQSLKHWMLNIFS